MPDSDEKSAGETLTFSSLAIRSALYRLRPTFGIALVNLLILALQAHGLSLASGHATYNLAEIQSALQNIFGNVTPMFIKSLKSALSTPD
ncbi:MAG TPA: hypothetical protein VJZ68_09385 [Nitrososphaera sp.]|nr:hypothetical protein [Nitrososphaera sp.]